MRTVEQIVEQIRAAASADFAFVLTRKGRLVTHRAPRDMPEEGRMRLARAARPLVGTDRVIEVTMPREELVPYGGAAPIDVYIGVVAEQAIVCIVMASWADKMHVAAELETGMHAIAPLLRRGLPVGRRASSDAEPAKGSPFRASVPPPPDSSPGAMGGDPPYPPVQPGAMGATQPVAAGGPTSTPVVELRPSLIPEVPDTTAGDADLPPLPAIPPLPTITVEEASLGRESMVAIRRDAARGGPAPEITVGEAPLGRETMVAIRREAAAGGSAPEITVGEAPLGRESMVAIRREAAEGGSLPDITVSEAPLGRASMIAIEEEAMPRSPSFPEAIRVELVSLPDADLAAASRATLPWVELAEDAKRAVDAAVLGRKLAPPKVTIKLEDAGTIEIDAPANAPAKRS